MAKTWTDSLDLLLSAYEQIGETIPQLLQYDKLFVQNPAMQRVLGLLYKDILEFHRRALVVFKRRCEDQPGHFHLLVPNITDSLETAFPSHLEGFQYTFRAAS